MDFDQWDAARSKVKYRALGVAESTTTCYLDNARAHRAWPTSQPRAPRADDGILRHPAGLLKFAWTSVIDPRPLSRTYLAARRRKRNP